VLDTFRGTDNQTAVGGYDIFLTKFSQPTPTPSSSTNTSTSSNTSTAKAPECADTKPFASPDLFQIDTNQNTATLYYVPAKDPVDRYYISYSTKENSFLYGVEYNQGYCSGVLSYTINYLLPNTTYYFTIRAGNGCMPGDWSTVLEAKTTNSVYQMKKFYKYTTAPKR
jgi:hypothetical protein